MNLTSHRSAGQGLDARLIPSPPKLKIYPEILPGQSTQETGLSTAEKADLQQWEQVIAEGLHTFFEVGMALLTIKCKRLYRKSFATFEEYCHRRWDMSRFYAYRLIGAAEVRQLLLPIGNIPLPKNEAQTRPLTKVAPELVPKVWKKAVEMAAGKEINHKHVIRALSKVQGKCPTRNGNDPAKDCYSVHLAFKMIRSLKKCVASRQTDEALRILMNLRMTIERMQFGHDKITEKDGAEPDS